LNSLIRLAAEARGRGTALRKTAEIWLKITGLGGGKPLLEVPRHIARL
jgi:hypothetical protein